MSEPASTEKLRAALDLIVNKLPYSYKENNHLTVTMPLVLVEEIRRLIK